ncbi:MAG: hypothetical protein QOG80_2396, partial [Pseudonocardiales bacterium]|nr:hypothetical protein [Pseudonocardiales bacterium]
AVIVVAIVLVAGLAVARSGLADKRIVAGSRLDPDGSIAVSAFRSSSRELRIAILGVVTCLSTVVAFLKAGYGAVPWWGLVLFAVALVGSELADVRFVVSGEVWSLSLTEIVLGMAFVVWPGGWVTLASGVAIAALMIKQHTAPLKTFYNVAMFTFAASMASVVSLAAGSSVFGASCAAATFAICNFALVTAAIKIATSRPLRQLVQMGGLLSVVQAIGAASVGILAGWLALNAPLGLLGLLVPMVLIWYSYRAQVRQAAESRMFSELASGHEIVAGRSIDTSARVVTSAAQRLLSGSAELVVLGGERPTQYLSDVNDGLVTTRTSTQALSEPWVIEALGSTGLSTGVQERAPYIVARLGSSDSPLAVLRVMRPEHSPVFERRDEMMASILIRQAESWLAMVELTEARDEAVARAEMADAANRVIGDLGTETIPALMQLRESAVRLSRLANTATSRDGVGDIVEELHAAERAVASLLGAIAMAADTALADEIVQLPTGTTMGEDDWTTTGTLDLEVVDGTP